MTRLYNAQLIGSLAQSVEQRTFNPLVERSNRSRPTKYEKPALKKAGFFYVWILVFCKGFRYII